MSATRRQFLTASLAGPWIGRATQRTPSRPNVVFVMTDDHGAWALGASGCGEIRTPAIDRLTSGGVRFANAFAATPVCSPSRMTYLTGRMPSTHGVQDYLRPPDTAGPQSRRWLEGQPAFTEILAQSGYTLGMCGKWHMGRDEEAQVGFTYWATVPGGGGTYRDPEFVVNGSRRKMNGYKTDLVTDAALEFLDQTKGRPFFLYLPHYAPHTPYDFQPEEHREYYYRNAGGACFPDQEPHPWANRSLRQHMGDPQSRIAYSALITGVDASLARIEKRLEEMGVRENTLIVFTADQGWNAGHHGFWGKGNGTWPFNMYEESIRVPMIWNHPARIRGGRTERALISNYDFFPTILDYLGVAAPADAKRPGRSYAGFLSGDPPKWRERWLYFEYSFVRAIRTDRWKFIERGGGFPSEFFDLDRDPAETRDLFHSSSHRGRREELRADLQRFFDRLGAPPLEQWLTTTRQELTRYSR